MDFGYLPCSGYQREKPQCICKFAKLFLHCVYKIKVFNARVRPAFGNVFDNAQTLIFPCFFLRAVQTTSVTYVFPELILSFYHHPLNIYISPPNILYLHISNFIHRFSIYVAEEIVNRNIQRNKGKNSSGILSFCSTQS